MSNKTTIGIIGLGLIGGSLLKSLKNQDLNLIGITRSIQTIETIEKSKIKGIFSTDINVLKDADIIFVCTPINKTNETIKTLAKITKKDCIITDAASIKAKITDFVNKLPDKINFIGGHPMAGTENKGYNAAPEDLFTGAKWVLTPLESTKQEDIDKLTEIIELTGAIPIIADAYEHDKAVALISHMPLLLSQALFELINNYQDKNISELAMTLAASGFRDMTRIAATNPELAEDMFFENTENVKSSTFELIDCLKDFTDKINTNSKESLLNKIENIVKQRKKMYSSDGKNVYKKEF